MADADLDVIIRKLAKQQHKSLTAAVKARRARYLALAAKAKDDTAKQRYRQMAKQAYEEGTAAARRLQMSADNAADSYARAMRRTADAFVAQPAASSKRAPARTAPSEAKAKKSPKS
ncbi:MAG: hypothetical protein ACTHK9_00360 [Nitrobacter sp.]|jgi:hypothetical protein